VENPETSETLFIEVSIQNPSRIEVEAYEAMDKFTSTFMRVDPGMQWSGRLLKTPAVPHLREITNRVGAAFARAQREQSFIEEAEDGTFHVAFCPDSKLSLLNEWCQTKGLQPGMFSGPPYDDNIVGRLKAKIEKEQQQLPNQFPNVLLRLPIKTSYSL
jgi:hypothetical protein